MKKFPDLMLMVMVVLMFGTVCMETDIYIPAFPLMKVFFQISDQQIQGVLSYNFIGICLGSLLFGPLADSFGRQKILRFGLGLFAFSSWGCVLFNNFDLFIGCRFLQGLGAAAPMVTSFSILLDKYEPKKVSQLCGALNIFIAGGMAASPILGSVLILYFNWKANFLIIAALSTLTLIGSFFFIEETLPRTQWLKFSPQSIVKDYGRMLISFPYMAGVLICYLLFSGLMVFIANLSLIFIEHLGVSQEAYGFYQAMIMGTFALVSTFSIWMIGRHGPLKTKYTGIFFVFLGTCLLLLVSYYNPLPIMICSAMAVFTAGATLASTIYSVEAVNIFPNMRGIAAGLSNALRYIVISMVIGFSTLIFNGSILPIVWLIVVLFLIVLFLALGLKFYKPRTS